MMQKPSITNRDDPLIFTQIFTALNLVLNSRYSKKWCLFMKGFITIPGGMMFHLRGEPIR